MLAKFRLRISGNAYDRISMPHVRFCLTDVRRRIAAQLKEPDSMIDCNTWFVGIYLPGDMPLTADGLFVDETFCNPAVYKPRSDIAIANTSVEVEIETADGAGISPEHLLLGMNALASHIRLFYGNSSQLVNNGGHLIACEVDGRGRLQQDQLAYRTMDGMPLYRLL